MSILLNNGRNKERLATKGRLRQLMYADINRECLLFEKLSGDVVCRQATQEELKKYSTINERKREKLHRELTGRR